MRCVAYACTVSAYLSSILQWLSRNQADSLWPSALQLLRDLCRESGCLPEALYASEVDFDSRRDPVVCGAFTDVYRGLLHKQEVAVKRVRIAGGPGDRETFTKVRVSCFVITAFFVLTLLSNS
jgi:hypothetical protein